MAKALVAMSGGVDSSVAAYLALEQGYDCIGGTMLLWQKEEAGVADAAAVAQRLGMPFHCFDATVPFHRQVIDPFIESYEQGLTPNPCILCNRQLKFSWLLDQALALGCSYVVTGHYARIEQDTSGRHLLYKAPEEAKDQSYFLAGLTPFQLAHARFPLGALTKEQVRTIAAEQGFENAKKRDSQDICFIPDGDYKAFMERYTGKTYPAGSFLDTDGRVVGTHCGAVGYTLGQRKGLGIALGRPVYVCAKDMQRNTVTVGDEPLLYANTLWATDCNFIPFPQLNGPMRVTAKARSRHQGQLATVYPEEHGIRVEFDNPQRAITPGQSVVLYDGDLVIGSAIIQKAK